MTDCRVFQRNCGHHPSRSERDGWISVLIKASISLNEKCNFSLEAELCQSLFSVLLSIRCPLY